MNIMIYDGTFEGLLTLVFESFRLKVIPEMILNSMASTEMIFDQPVTVTTDLTKADRVWNKIIRQTSGESAGRLYLAFQSELPETPQLIYRYIRLMIESEHNIETDYTSPIVLSLARISRKVAREAHRVQMFSRFQQTAENSWYASVSPIYNVLPTCVHHFRDRFSDVEWTIYDLKRNYGFYHRNSVVERITFEVIPAGISDGRLKEQFLHPEEEIFRKLWKDYYHHISIGNRFNPQLHRQLLPKRFWRYLPEKQPDF